MNAKTPFTPGPWHQNDELSRHGTKLVYAADGHLVADAGRIHHRTEDESEANARLIAATPDLFNALNCIMMNVGASAIATGKMEKMRAEPWWIAAEVAIAKATGAAS